MRDKSGKFIKGSKAPKTAFKKGIIPWNKGKTGFKGFWNGKKFSKQHRENLSKSHIGQIAWNKGKEFHQISMEKHHNWKGGKIMQSGYILIKSPNHPSCENRGYVREHRLVCEEYLGKYLPREADVHHINGIKTDNKIKNLMVFINRSSHRRFENGKSVKPEEILFDGSKITSQ